MAPMNTRLFLTSSLVASLVLSACGGEQKHPKSAESDVMMDTSSKEDMPPAPVKEVEATAPTTTPATTTASGSVGGAIKVAAMKFTPAKKGKTARSIELKDDGTVNVDGKAAAKIAGDSVDSTRGTSMLTVGLDGSLVGNAVNPGMKFDGDAVVHENGMKLTVDDDGTITASKAGKTEAIGKAEGAAASKRAALVVAVLYMNIPTSMTNGKSEATGAKATEKAGTKSAAPEKK